MYLSNNHSSCFFPWQGLPGLTGPKGQRGERVSLTCAFDLDWLLSGEIWAHDTVVCWIYLLLWTGFFCVSNQGEPGYVIAGTDSNFVPGRKGEPGSSVSPQKKLFWWFSTVSFRTTQISFIACYRVPRDLLVYQGSMELQAYLARRDHQGHREYLSR